jgi:hypothetical protein
MMPSANAEGKVDAGGNERRKQRRNAHHAAAGYPQQRQCRQRHAAQRRLAGPVRHRGHHEPGETRGGKTVDHLMGVPGDIPLDRQRDPAEHCRDPERHQHHPF